MWRDEVLKGCSESHHPSSSPVVGAGRAWVSARPVSCLGGDGGRTPPHKVTFCSDKEIEHCLGMLLSEFSL